MRDECSKKAELYTEKILYNNYKNSPQTYMLKGCLLVYVDKFKKLSDKFKKLGDKFNKLGDKFKSYIDNLTIL